MTARAKQAIAKVIEEKGDSGLFKVSQSKVNTWRRCRAAYNYKYVDKLRKKRKSRPLQFGSIVHSMLEAYANGDDAFDKLDEINIKDMRLFQVEKEEYGEIIEDIRVIMTEYFLKWPDKSLMYLRQKGKGAEHHFEVEILPGVLLTGKIDGFAKSPNKLRWLVEHKTFTRMPNEDSRWRNLQSSVYIRVSDMLGLPPVDGTLWDYIFSKPPAYPEMLKSGQMSQRGIDSLPTRVLQTLKEHRLKPKDFGTLIESVTANRNKYFQRIFTPDKPGVVDKVWKDLLETAQEMLDLHGKRKARTIDKHCSWCDYEGLCRGELQGSDVDYIKGREYYVSTGKDEDYGADSAAEVA